jgi:cell division protein FtsL
MPGDDKFRTSVIAGLVASVLFVLLLQPILNWASSVLVAMSGHVASTMSDRLYQRAALGAKHDLGPVVLSYFALLTVMIPVVSIPLLGLRPERPVHPQSTRLLGVVGFIVAPIILVFALLLTAVAETADARLNAKFQQRVTILAPHVTDREAKELAAQWASMKSRTHYDGLNSRIDALAKTHGVELPVVSRVVWK